MQLAAAAIIGMQMITNLAPAGQTWIGFQVADLSIEQAMATEWQVQSDAPFLLRARPTSCGHDPMGQALESGSVFHCWVELPVVQDIHFVQVRREGAEWSAPWQASMIPCGFFVGEQVFRNVTAKLGWPASDQVGTGCTLPVVEPPTGNLQPTGQPVVK